MSVRFELVSLAVGETQTFKLADGRNVMVVAVPADTRSGGDGPSGGGTDEPTKPTVPVTPIKPPTTPGGHVAAIVEGLGLDPTTKDIDRDHFIAGDALTLRIEPSLSDPLPGLRIVSDDIMRATQRSEASEIVVHRSAIRGDL